MMRTIVVILYIVFGSIVMVHADTGITFFEQKVRPALVKYCYECHSIESGKSKGGLRVDSHHALLQGGDSGPAIVPGQPHASMFIKALHYSDPDFEMPPKGKLDDRVIEDFEKWIEMGAPGPRKDADPSPVKSLIDIEKGRDFWSFKSPISVSRPVVKDKGWPRSEIDYFVLSRLEDNDLLPSPPAEAFQLIRRLYFTLTGLPPTPEEMINWEKRIGPDLDAHAVEELTDQLLASPRFGEHWGQHWLDVVRYADSTGGDANNIYPHAWRYRDYVIDSFNRDKPFDHMIREQLAGDLLPISNDREWADNLVATGFLAIGQKLVGEVEDRKFFADLVDEQIDATSRAFLGLTVSCARCHDHKTDPIPQEDYYSLAAIFRNTQTHYGLVKAQARQFSTLLDVTGMGLPVGANKLSVDEFTELKQAKLDAFSNMDELMGRIRSYGEKVTRANLRRSRTKRDLAETALQSYDEDGNPLSFAMGVQEREGLLSTRVLLRGELDKPGPLVQAGYLQVISPKGRSSLPDSIEGSGRRHLAEWIASSRNPLTGRVIANRVWYWLFGQGIVVSVDDFGATGSKPSHPELLDFLALRMVENGWSLKKTIREIVLSKTWQQSTAFDEENYIRDPDNIYLWKSNQRRVNAESYRDSLLLVSGELEYFRPTVSLLKPIGEGSVGQNVFEPEIRKITSNRRSVYLPRVRNVLPEVLELYDAPDASNVNGKREITTVPLQALYSINSNFVRDRAKAFAARVAERPSREQIGYAHMAVFGRLPFPEERMIASEFVSRFRSKADEPEGDLRSEAMVAYCHALMCAAEFQVID